MRQRKKRGLRQKPWEPVKMSLYEVPNPFPVDIPKEERIKVVRSIVERAQKELDIKYPQIEQWFSKYDTLYILSYCLLYFLAHPEGTDPEATGSLEFPHYFIEIMQAFALYQERNYSLEPLQNNANKLKQDMKDIGDLMQLCVIKFPDGEGSEEILNRYRLRTEMMSSTMAIRNWAYFHQMERVTQDLARLMKEDFQLLYDVNPEKIVEIFYEIIEFYNEKLNNHIDKIRSFAKKYNYRRMIESYNQAFPENEPIQGEEIETIWNSVGRKAKRLRMMLWAHADLKLEQIFTVNINELVSFYKDDSKKEAIRKIFDLMSYSFGDLKKYNKEYLILDNPIHHRPFIKINENDYYSAIFGIFPHICLSLIEDLIAIDDSLRSKYCDRIKPSYLENEVERLFRSNFPNATIIKGCEWLDKATQKTYENDLLVIIDTFAIVVEAKSGLITPPAKRGAPDRLFETLKELIEEPAEQAHRLIAFLKENKDKTDLILSNKQGKKTSIDCSKIRYCIPLGITLENIGAISCNLKRMIDAGITEKGIAELALSISLTDLESIFEILPLEAEKIHYFARRRELENHVYYHGDELDLLAFYLDNGFNMGDVEYEDKISMNLTLKSKELDPYFIGTHEGINVNKPGLSLTKWWKDLLEFIASRRTEHWIETSYILLNVIKNDQEKMQNNIIELQSRIRSGRVEKKHNWVVLLAGAKQRCFLIAGYPYLTEDKEERNAIIQTIVDSDDARNARGVVVIGIDMNKKDYTYSVIAGRLNTDLFAI